MILRSELLLILVIVELLLLVLLLANYYYHYYSEGAESESGMTYDHTALSANVED